MDINHILDTESPIDSFIRKNKRIEEVVTNKVTTSGISRPSAKDVVDSIKR